MLLSRDAWAPARIAALRKFCDDRSFDVSWYPGIDVAAARAGIYNDLPAVSFSSGEVQSGGPDDSIADEAGAVLAGADSPSRELFNLTPMTLNRPYFYAVLRLDQLGTLLRRLEILPQGEIGGLVNLAVLAQAAVIAVLVLLVPLAAPRRLRSGAPGLLRAALYFPALALGFLFVEIALIERASFWLNDRTSGFAVVLTGMLVFSGVGSMAADRLAAAPRKAIAAAVLVVLAWCIAVSFGLLPLMLATLSWPWLARAALVLGVLAPASLALGLPFPLGPGARRRWWGAALGLGAERRLLRGGDAAGQPGRTRGGPDGPAAGRGHALHRCAAELPHCAQGATMGGSARRAGLSIAAAAGGHATRQRVRAPASGPAAGKAPPEPAPSTF